MSHPYGLRLVDQLLLHTVKQNKKNVSKLNNKSNAYYYLSESILQRSNNLVYIYIIKPCPESFFSLSGQVFIAAYSSLRFHAKVSTTNADMTILSNLTCMKKTAFRKLCSVELSKRLQVGGFISWSSRDHKVDLWGFLLAAGYITTLYAKWYFQLTTATSLIKWFWQQKKHKFESITKTIWFRDKVYQKN